MESLVGPTFSIDVSPPPPPPPQGTSSSASSSPFFFKDENEIASHLISRFTEFHDDDRNSTDSSSSIGDPDVSDEEEVDSSGGALLACLDSLEDALPIRRGLSNHFDGKSKSFANLADVSGEEKTAKDLVKPHNPFNKRRRILVMARRRNKSSFYTSSNPKSMPLLALPEEPNEQQHQNEDEDHHNDDGTPFSISSSSSFELDQHRKRQLPILPELHHRKFKSTYKSHSCFNLSDLQHQKIKNVLTPHYLLINLRVEE